jgi:hypothetical protein
MMTLTDAVLQLAPPGGVFDETVVRNLFPDSSEGARKLLVHRAVTSGEVIRLKPGVFLLAPPYRKSEPHPYVLAALLHAPSHISLESALAHHGLIPEAVQQVSSVTALRSRTFTTPAGVFSFQRVPARDPRAGVEAVKLEPRAWAFVATPLRALADLIYLNKSISWSKDGPAYILESLRIEADDLAAISAAALEAICASLRSRRVATYLERLAREVHLAE